MLSRNRRMRTFRRTGARRGRISLLLCQEKCNDGQKVAGPFCFCTFRVHFGTLTFHRNVQCLQGQPILTLSAQKWQQTRYLEKSGGRSSGIPTVCIPLSPLNRFDCILSQKHMKLLSYMLRVEAKLILITAVDDTPEERKFIIKLDLIVVPYAVLAYWVKYIGSKQIPSDLCMS